MMAVLTIATRWRGNSKDERIRLFRSEHRGVERSAQYGIGEATGEIISYLNSDNVWTSEFLLRMAVFMSSRGLSCGYAAVRIEE